jgi:hypothetical protein
MVRTYLAHLNPTGPPPAIGNVFLGYNGRRIRGQSEILKVCLAIAGDLY